MLGFFVLSGLLACGQPEESESALVSDTELLALRDQAVPPEVGPAQAPSGRSFYVRLTWGRLEGRQGKAVGASSVVLGQGTLTVDQGTVQLSRTLTSDSRAASATQDAPDRIAWTGEAAQGFDGVVARVEVPSDDATLTIETPRFRRAFRASELEGGDDAVFAVGSGVSMSVASVPASVCPGGFVLGSWKASRWGWLAFGGRTTDRTGRLQGLLRFRVGEDGALKGRLLDESGREQATVRGTLVREGDVGGSFSAEIIDGSGRALGSLTGLFSPATGASLGSFQATYEQVCEE
jgi:hypothetical protein